MSLSQQDRIDEINKSRWIGYTRSHEILNRLEDLLRYPRQTRMPSMVISGQTNNGKSSIIEHFAKSHPPDMNPGGDHIIAPVILMQAPPTPSEDAFYIQILQKLYEHVPSSSRNARRNRVVEVLREIQVKMLIVDELHNVLAGASTRQQEVFNMLKFLSNELQISIVGCGTGDLLRAVNVDNQIQNRFKPEVLPRWKYDTEARRLLKSYEKLLPLKQPSRLDEPQLAKRIIAIGEGTIGEMLDLLKTAAKYVIRNEEEMITSETLDACGYISPSKRKDLAKKL